MEKRKTSEAKNYEEDILIHLRSVPNFEISSRFHYLLTFKRVWH